MYKLLILVVGLVGACQAVTSPYSEQGTEDMEDTEDTSFIEDSDTIVEEDSDSFSEALDTSEDSETDSDTFEEDLDTDSLTPQEECGCPEEAFPLEKRQCNLDGNLVEKQPIYHCNQGTCVEIGIAEEKVTACEYGCDEVFSGSVYDQTLTVLLFQGTIRDCKCPIMPVYSCKVSSREIYTEHYDALQRECAPHFEYDSSYCVAGFECVEISETETECQDI